MQTVYDVIDKLLPFKELEMTFMKNAFIAILILCPILGIIGTLVVNKNMSFFSESLGHSAFTGIALGVIMGIKNPTVSLILFGIIFALCIVYIRSKNFASNDTTIAVFSATSIALGIALLSFRGGLNQFTSYLSGDILSITVRDIISLLIVAIFVLVYIAVCFNKLLLLSVNQSLASSRGINKNANETVFMVVTAVVVMVAIKWVGMLLINAMLIMPAASSRNCASNVRTYLLGAVLISTVCGIAGLLMSYSLGIPSGATIIMLCAICYFLTLLVRSLKKS